jgi:hypothetical protein
MKRNYVPFDTASCPLGKATGTAKQWKQWCYVAGKAIGGTRRGNKIQVTRFKRYRKRQISGDEANIIGVWREAWKGTLETRMVKARRKTACSDNLCLKRAVGRWS